MRNFFIGLLLTIIGIAALMLIPSKQAPAPMPWEVKLFQDGSSEVFNIRFNHSTLADAQQIFHEAGELAIFNDNKSRPALEVFFNSVHLGGLTAKIVLIHIDDQKKAQGEVIDTLTYIPSIRLDEEAIRHRFGNPETIEHIDFSEDEPSQPETNIWHYPSIGLSIRLSPKEKTVLQYQAPPATNNQY